MAIARHEPSEPSRERAAIKALMARAGDSWCALPLASVRQVIPALKLFPLPGGSDEIAGLAEVDGEPVVVLSLERLINAPAGASAEFPVTLLVEAGAAGAVEVVGLAADEAGDIVHLDDRQILGPAHGLIVGETQLDVGVVRLLDMGRLGAPR